MRALVVASQALQPERERGAMAGASMAIGKRNKALNRSAVKVAKAVGTIDVDYGDDNSCEPLDVLKHLTSDWLTKKLGV